MSSWGLPPYLALAWPLAMQFLILELLACSMLTHLPAIYDRHSWKSPYWPGLAVCLIVVALGSLLVIREPFTGFPQHLLATPGASLGLHLSACALFDWFLTTELAAKHYTKKER